MRGAFGNEEADLSLRLKDLLGPVTRVTKKGPGGHGSHAAADASEKVAGPHATIAPAGRV